MPWLQDPLFGEMRQNCLSVISLGPQIWQTAGKKTAGNLKNALTLLITHLYRNGRDYVTG